jgi:hypothetical protein
MPPSPSERALKTRLFPEGLVKRVTRLTLSARNTYTGERGIRKFQGRCTDGSWQSGSRVARTATFPEERVIERPANPGEDIITHAAPR